MYNTQSTISDQPFFSVYSKSYIKQQFDTVIACQLCIIVAHKHDINALWRLHIISVCYARLLFTTDKVQQVKGNVLYLAAFKPEEKSQTHLEKDYWVSLIFLYLLYSILEGGI
ncbi:MAG: hypothetical protein ABFS56_35360 [Pseudomonadota bacterium]